MVKSVSTVLLGSYSTLDNSMLIEILEVPWVIAVILSIGNMSFPESSDFSSTLTTGPIWLSVHESESRKVPGGGLRLAHIILNDQIVLLATQKNVISLANHVYLYITFLSRQFNYTIYFYFYPL